MATNIFKKRRVELGLTQRQVSIDLGTTTNTVSNWEAGRSFPRRGQIQRIAEVLKVKPEVIAKELVATAKD